MNWKLHHVVQNIICTSFCYIYIYHLLRDSGRDHSLSHTHTSFRILVAILLNNKHPTFQLDLIRKVCRILLHDTIYRPNFLYLWDRLSKKSISYNKEIKQIGGVLLIQQRNKVSHGKDFLFSCPKEYYFTEKTVSSNKIFLVVSRKFEKFTTVHCMFFVVEQFTNFFCMIQSNVID